MWRFKHFMPKDQSGLEGRMFDVGNLKIQVRNVIAEGGFSCVYLARDFHSGKQYALKHIICNDEESLDLVRKEIDVMELLKGHPNVVTLHEHAIMYFGRTKEAFLVMEFCERSLVSVLESRGAGFFEEKQILLIFRDVCNAVFAMHCQSPPIAHRDLKAENLLLGQDGAWKLCDFGSTSTLHKRYERAEEMGIEEDNIRKHTTPAYRAPEMWDLFMRELINERVDIWALGCLLYRICYFKSAFDGESKLQILNGNYRIPELPRYSSSVTELIKDMLQTTPDARPDITQVWFRVNEQLPIELQKEMPDTPHSVVTGDAQKCTFEGKDDGPGFPSHPKQRTPTPSKPSPPLPSSKQQFHNSSSMQSNAKPTGSGGHGAFWSTVHAQGSFASEDVGPNFDEEDPNITNISKDSRQSTTDNRHNTPHSVSPPKEHHMRIGNHVWKSAPGNVHRTKEGPSEGYEIRFFPESVDQGPDPSNSSSFAGNKASKSESGGTSFNETFSSFVAEFDHSKLYPESEAINKKLQAEVDKLKEELKQVHMEKTEIASKYEKLVAICRSQRQEIQELKQAVASGSPSLNKDELQAAGGSQMQPQNQKSPGSCQSNNQLRAKIEGSLCDLQQGMFSNNPSVNASTESSTWQAFADNQDAQHSQKYNPKMSVCTTSKGAKGRTAKPAADAWGFGEDNFTATPGQSQPPKTFSHGNAQFSGNTAKESSNSQPAGWAGF